MHGEGAAPLGGRAQGGGIPEHSRQWNAGRDGLDALAVVDGFDLAATRIEIADHLTHESFRDEDFDPHDRIEQIGLAIAKGCFDGHRSADLEGQFGAQGFPVFAVRQDRLDIDNRIPHQRAAFEGLHDPGRHRGGARGRQLFGRQFVHEAVPRAAGLRHQAQPDAAEMPLPGHFLVEERFAFARRFDGFPVDHLGFAHVHVRVELALHAVGDDLQMQLPHTGEDRLAGVLVDLDFEGGVLVQEFAQHLLQFFLIGMGLGFDRHRDDRLVELDLLQQHRIFSITQGLARRGGLEPDDADDASGRRDFNALALVGVHHQDARNTLLFAARRVVDFPARRQLAAVDPGERHLAALHQGHLEDQRGQRCAVLGRALDGLPGFGMHTGDRRDVQRAGKIVHDGIQQGLDALVFERAAAEHRHEF